MTHLTIYFQQYICGLQSSIVSSLVSQASSQAVYYALNRPSIIYAFGHLSLRTFNL